MMTDSNAIDLLEQQHEEIRRLLAAVAEAGDVEGRQRAFDELRALIAVHETAEEIVVRPVTRQAISEGEAVADARMAEENQGKHALAELEDLDTESPEFRDLFTVFRRDVEAHAQQEEEVEFTALRGALDDATLRSMGAHVRRAEALAPTHPHPSVKSTEGNLVLGPFASMADRVRDALGALTTR
jgi:hypothetical protein